MTFSSFVLVNDFFTWKSLEITLQSYAVLRSNYINKCFMIFSVYFIINVIRYANLIYGTRKEMTSIPYNI